MHDDQWTMPSARLYTEVAGTRSGPASAHGRGSVARLDARGVARSTIRDSSAVRVSGAGKRKYRFRSGGRTSVKLKAR